MLKKDNVFIVTKQNLYDAGDAIREKTGDSDLIPIKDMDDAIGSIETGITPSGTIQIAQNGQGIDVAQYANADVSVPNTYTQADEGKVVDNGALVAQTSESITQNGVYDTTKKNSVMVNVSGTNNKEADLIKGTLSGSYMNNDFTNRGVRPYGFDGFDDLTSLSLPNCPSIGDYGICNCRHLGYVDLPDVTLIGTNGLSSIGFSLNSGVIFNLPKLVTIGQYGFTKTRLESISLPECEYINMCAFQGLRGTDIEIDLSKHTHVQSGANSSIPTSCFKSSNIKSLILRSEDNIWPLERTDAFQNTPIASGTGYIYVPAALKSTYEAATNWVTYAAQFRALEDYTVDGTTTGALDPTKV